MTTNILWLDALETAQAECRAFMAGLADGVLEDISGPQTLEVHDAAMAFSRVLADIRGRLEDAAPFDPNDEHRITRFEALGR